MLYLKKFNTREDYNNSSPLSKIRVSLISDSDTVLYEADNDTPFYVEALEDLAVSLSDNAVEYSMDGTTWVTLEAGEATPVINKGLRVAFRANNLVPDLYDGIGTFSITGLCNVGGNIMSMLFGEDYKEQYSLSNHQSAFRSLFQGANIVNAKDLKLPALVLSNSCYFSMFQDCTNLVSTPILPAATLVGECYSHMFQSCKSLVSAPELPATSLAADCYENMFYGCESLISAPELPATNLYPDCYRNMFYNCTSLTSAPELPATNLAASCYESMFQNCRALTSAPELPATNLAASCYKSMFNGCSSLTSASALPAMSLEQSCYERMYEYCTSLSAAPALPATTLVLQCYKSMFNHCSSLTSAPELPAMTLAQGCYDAMFCATSLQVAPDLPATKLERECYSGMFELCRELKEMPIISATSGARYACSRMFSSCSGLTSVYIPNCSGAYCFYSMFSNCSGLTSVPSFSGYEASEFESMFYGCTGLTEVTFEDIAPSGYKTYRFLFEKCSNISRVTVLATAWPSADSYLTTDNWLYGVAEQGTFVKPAGVEIPVGSNGIPEGWTVEEVEV